MFPSREMVGTVWGSVGRERGGNTVYGRKNNGLEGILPGYGRENTGMGGILPGYGRDIEDDSIKFTNTVSKLPGRESKPSIGLYIRTGLNDYRLGRGGGKVLFPGGDVRKG